ncbi:PepSY domain-containing protein [Paracoccus suum]|uniref:PepSY domain-containing protein n=1 Tax=Paracoccus suum TaxID=2259340 RepID=A0A344PIM1_9RHOB|nr:PepSY domain-containing protein [Paracoccus suum]AXC49226.1 PepSY domain-containing protein [Paracoccus suum]
MTDISLSAAAKARADSSALYRAIWRWHFIAGLLVIPFVLLLATTGGIYLFKDEINDLLHRDLRIVPVTQSAQLPASAIVSAALTNYPGTLKSYLPAPAPGRSTEVKIENEEGITQSVYVDPTRGTVLGALGDGGAAGSPEMQLVRQLHSLAYFGWLPQRFVELAAGWMVLLTASGIYLWWPRGKRAGTFTVKAARGRPWWRDIHAVTGIYTAGFILFLAMSGLPWSGYWGAKFYDLAYQVGLGMPDGYWFSYPTSTVPVGAVLDKTPWIMERQPMPLSTASDGTPAGLDQVVATVEALGIAPGYGLDVPSDPEGVFTASVYPDDVRRERVIHLDQYSGKVLFDMGVADLGALGAAAELGVSLHTGQYFGVVNQIALLLACLAMIVMCIAAVTMWWKRRPSGSLGTPRVGAWRVPTGLILLGAAAGLFFPLVGLSMLVMAAIEWVIARRQTVA